MRIITNRSTGDMGRLIAAEFFRRGARVTLLEGQLATSTLRLDPGISLKNFFYYDELKALLDQALVCRQDVVIHAAAVSDFKLSRPFKGKIASGRPLTLNLVPTGKLVNTIKKKAPGVFLVGFKFETRLAQPYVLSRVDGLFREAGCDLVVANCLKSGCYEACLIDPMGRVSTRVSAKKMLVKVLAAQIDKRLS